MPATNLYNNERVVFSCKFWTIALGFVRGYECNELSSYTVGEVSLPCTLTGCRQKKAYGLYFVAAQHILF